MMQEDLCTEVQHHAAVAPGTVNGNTPAEESLLNERANAVGKDRADVMDAKLQSLCPSLSPVDRRGAIEAMRCELALG